MGLSASQTNVPAAATAASVSLTTAGPCAWSAYSTVPWIQINAGSVSGQGSGVLSYVVAGNPGTSARTGSLLIGDQTYTVTQAGGPNAIPTSYTSTAYTSTNQRFSGDGGQVGGANVYYPMEMVFDTAGNFYIADQGNARIRRVDVSGTITTVAGGGSSFPGDGGSPTAATLSSPSGVAVDRSGNLYISDTSSHRIRKVSNNVITTIAGTGVAGYNGDNKAASTATVWSPRALS
jgi:hypothetical protein